MKSFAPVMDPLLFDFRRISAVYKDIPNYNAQIITEKDILIK